MSQGLPSHVSKELQPGETLISYIPEPDLTARRRIILALSPLFIFFLILVLWGFNDRKHYYSGAVMFYAMAALVIYSLRLCRTSYAISARRVVRFVTGQKAGDVEYAESEKPLLIDFSAGGNISAKWAARFLSLGPLVEIRRLKSAPWALKALIFGGDRSGMRIGYPGHSVPIAKIFDEVTRAWDAAQTTPKATP